MKYFYFIWQRIKIHICPKKVIFLEIFGFDFAETLSIKFNNIEDLLIIYFYRMLYRIKALLCNECRGTVHVISCKEIVMIWGNIVK